MEPNSKDIFVTRFWFLVLPLVLIVVLLGASRTDAQFQEAALLVTEADSEVLYSTHDKGFRM